MITAEFDSNPLDDNDSANLICNAYELGNFYVTMEREIFGKTEQLFRDRDLLSRVADNFYSQVRYDEEPKWYRLTIRGVYHAFDAAIYRCKIHDLQGNIVHSASAVLQINYIPAEFNPKCSIKGNKNLTRNSGSEVVLSCFSDLGFPPVDPPEWSYIGCNGNSRQYLPTPSLTNSVAYYSELRVTLSERDNGGMFICTISKLNVNFRRSCSFGTFNINGVSDCEANRESPATQGPATVIPPATQDPRIPPVIPEIPTPFPTTAPDSPVTVAVSFTLSPVNNGDIAEFNCRAQGLAGTEYSVEIWRQRDSVTERLFANMAILPGVGGSRISSTVSANGGIYSILVTNVEDQDGGTYTCRVGNEANSIVIHSASAVLEINPASYRPSCSINDDQTLTRHAGSAVLLVCYTETGFPSVNPPAWSYVACDGRSRMLPEPRIGLLAGGLYATLQVTLTEEDNGGSFICTVSRSDGTSYSKSCTPGTFAIIGAKGCGETTVVTTTNNPLQATTQKESVMGRRITATFLRSPVDPGDTAIFRCEAYGLESGDYVTIVRMESSRSRVERLFEKDEVWRQAPRGIRPGSISADGSDPKTYELFIGRVEYRYDAKTYTCTINTWDNTPVISASTVLQITGPQVAPRAGNETGTLPPPNNGLKPTLGVTTTIICFMVSSLIMQIVR